MGFESGSVSFRAFYLPRRLPSDHVSRFAAQAAPTLEALGREPISGWVTGRHLLDRNINDETAYHAGYLRLCLMKAERKIPQPLLRAECMMEQLAEMQARGVAFLKRPEKSEIKKGVIERLLPKMPPQLKGMPVVGPRDGDVLYAGTISDKQIDAFTLAVRQAVDIDPVPVTPATAAMKRKRLSVKDLSPTSFSPECGDDEVSDSVGQDFLTWLWFFSEVRGGLMSTDLGDFAVMIGGPLTFVMEGGGAHEAQLRRGEPLLSAEAKTSLMSGKKLRHARVTLARREEEWSVTLDGDEFVFRGLKLPKGEQLDAVSRFQQRMLATDTFLSALLSYYDRFLEERFDPSRWAETRKEIHGWVSDRRGRR